jgi:predicted kinase
MVKSNFVVLCGIPYSGKTHFLKTKFLDHKTISLDSFLHAKATEEGITYNESFSRYIASADYAKKELLKFYKQDLSQNVLVDQTNLTSKTRRALLEFAGNRHKVAIWFPLPSLEVLEERIQLRSSQVIPPNVIKHMADIYSKPSLEEGFDEVHCHTYYE